MKNNRISRLGEQLAAAPEAVRARMLADVGKLKPGAAAVVGRFFAILADRGERHEAPSRASFDAAARSEPTLHTLLVALECYAPEVNSAAGRESRRDWYRRRVKRSGKENDGPASAARSLYEGWPREWRALLPGLLAARSRLSGETFQQYVYSIGRCARTVADLELEPRIDRWLGANLLQRFRAEGLTSRTAANYLIGLHALARFGGMRKDVLDGLADLIAGAGARATREPRRKEVRVQALHARGGYAVLVETAARLRDEALEKPAWTAVAERMLQTAAILAVIVNAAPRTGDIARWRFGEQLVREPSGTWRLAWRQNKTQGAHDLEDLWPEVCVMLDELICCGRPQRLAGQIYTKLLGLNWLTHADRDPPSRWPSRLVGEVIGAPMHDVRTLAADYLRRHDPKIGARIASTLLGHRHAASIASYRVLAEGVAAARNWQEIKVKIAGTRTTPKAF